MTTFNEFENVISSVHYSHIAENEDGQTVQIDNLIDLPTPEEVFVPIDQLTQSDIIEWIRPLIDTQEAKKFLDAKFANGDNALCVLIYKAP